MARSNKVLLVLASAAFICGASGLTFENKKEPAFLDCDKESGNSIFGGDKRCCHSDQLPKGCECFDISISSGYTNSLFEKPECPEKQGNFYTLYYRGSDEKGVVITGDKKSLKKSGFDPALPTKFITHGFTDHSGSKWVLDMKDEILKADKCNVITVNWSDGAKGPMYPQAVANTRTVGAMAARLITDIVKITGTSLESFHLIGHSLGAHVSGFAGKEVFRLTGEKVARITGLDPAGVSFENYPEVTHITKNDATFVDIIHTDGKPFPGGLAYIAPVGHVDFFPNDGHDQPGCPKSTGFFNLFNIHKMIEANKCSHMRSAALFTSSINTCKFAPQEKPLPDGTPCVMGYHVSKACSGEFHLTTTGTKPFCE